MSNSLSFRLWPFWQAGEKRRSLVRRPFLQLFNGKQISLPAADLYIVSHVMVLSPLVS